MKKITVHSDGGARGNPGPAAIGVVVTDEAGEVLHELSEYIGESTNNIAEYTAVDKGISAVSALFADKTSDIELEWKLDSELVEKQLAGEYKVKNPGLRPLFESIQNKRTAFGKVAFIHVRREFNKDADRLVNEALDAL